jgi:hypothetical protein
MRDTGVSFTVPVTDAFRDFKIVDVAAGADVWHPARHAHGAFDARLHQAQA